MVARIGIVVAVLLISSKLYSDEYVRSWDGRLYSPTASEVYTNISSDTYSEIMAIDALFNDFRGPLESGNVAVTYNIAEAGISYDGWRFARILRYDYSLKFSEDTARLNFQIERAGSESINQNQAYDIYLKADHIRSKGFLFAKTLAFKAQVPLVFDVELSWMSSRQYYEGFVSAQVNQGNLNEADISDFEQEINTIADVDFSRFSELVAAGEMAQIEANALRDLIETSMIRGSADYSYYEPALREENLEGYEPIDARGSGFALSVQMFAELNERWILNLDIRDLYSRIQWKNTGKTRANIRATEGALAAMDVVDHYLQEDVIKRFSGSDFTPLNPDNPGDPAAALPGIQARLEAEYLDYAVERGSFTQALPIRTTLHSEYQLNDWFAATLTYQQNPVTEFISIGGRVYDLFSFSLEPNTQSLRLGVSHPYFSIAIRSDASSIDDAKRLSLMSSFRVPWR